MISATRSELLKFFTTRLWWGMAIAFFVLGAALAALFAFFSDDISGQGASDLDRARTVFTGGIQLGYLLMLAIGIMTIGAEYRHKTVTSTFLAVPQRIRVMSAKVVSLLLIGIVYGLIFLVGSVAVGWVVLSSKGHAPFADPSIWRTLALSLFVLGLWALIGLGAGILIPNQIAALLITVGIAWIVEPILGLVLSFPEWGRSIVPYLPSQATSAMLSATQNNGPNGGGAPTIALLAWWAGALVLAAYAAVMAGFGSWLTVRRDIS